MDFLSCLKNFFQASSFLIDNWVFTLHYKVTTSILIAFSIVVMTQQYLGDPIDCITRNHDAGELTKILDDYCWIHPTFSVTGVWKMKVGKEIPYPGIGKYSPGENKKYHAFYQWVWHFLLLQAIMFYIPRYFWNLAEGGRIKKLVSGLESSTTSEKANDIKRKNIVQYFSCPLRHHGRYFFCFVAAEVMNLVNVVGQIFLMEAFLGGQFCAYAISAIFSSKWETEVRYTPLIEIFPRMTKCSIYRYGSSGDPQRFDSLCLLPINSVNEKIFIFLSFWFVILAAISSFALIYRVAIITSKNIRLYSTQSRVSMCNVESLQSVIKVFTLGDWFMFDVLAKNMDYQSFRDIVDDLAKSWPSENPNGFSMTNL